MSSDTVETNSGNGFKFPECWKNDVRMGALFAPFRSKTVNPNDWSSKMKFWTSLIESWCKHNKCPAVNVSDLRNDFSRKEMVPACLEDVLQNLHRTGVIVLKEDFIASNESWKDWVVGVLVTRPLKWTCKAVKYLVVGKDDQNQVTYVHLPVIQYLGEKLIKQIHSSSSSSSSSYSQRKLIAFDELMELWKVEDAENLLLVLHWLQKQGSAAICEENNCTFVKLSKTGMKPVRITETDKGICNLEKQKQILENNIKKLEEEKNIALEETKNHLKAKMKSMAKISLRKKKALEKRIETRVNTLENIQSLLHKIDEIELDAEVIECYQKGIASLKEIFKETGLNEEAVYSTMEELEEALNSGNEIEEALSKPLDVSLEQSLEKELNELLLKDLPAVPTESPLDGKFDEKKKKKKDAQELTDEPADANLVE